MSNYNTLKTTDTITAISIVDGAITTSKLNTSVTTLIGSGGGPKATAITYPGNDLAADTAGGQTITVTGTGFVAGCSVFIGTTQASVVTVVSATSVTFTTPALAAATYTLYLVNPDGGTATIVPGISYSGTPTWTTGAGSLASIYEYSAINNTITATGDGSIVYSVFSGTLPTGSSLNTTTGVITGTSPASAGATTYTFVIRATDAQLQDTDRTFSITINTDAVTWTTPAANSTVTLGQSLASTTTLLATSAASNAITYTANTLPTGMSISGATVTGTPTIVGNTTSTFTATAATTNRTATAIINWTVSVANDPSFPYTTLLLSGAVATETFVADASTNNFAVAIAGDTKPNNFNPYTPGYYSNYFNGSSNFTSSTSQIVPTGSFTVECWVYVTSTANQAFVAQGTSANAARFSIAIDGGLWWTQIGNASINTGTPIINTWNYLAVTFNGSTLTLYVNGTSIGTLSTSTSAQNTTLSIGTYGPSWAGYFATGYISNVRVSSVVRTIITPTAPYTSDASTRLLTCQSNRFLDNSANAFALTITGTPSVQSSTPFVPNTQYATYGSTYFDGTGDYLTTPSSSLFNLNGINWTVEGWFNLVSATSESDRLFVFAGASVSWGFYRRAATGNIYFGQMGTDEVLLGNMLLNEWTHLALVRTSGPTISLYKNGVFSASTAAYSMPNENCTFLIAGNPAPYANTVTKGYVSDVRVVKGTAVYTSAFTPPSAPLTAVTNTSLLTCQTNQPVNNSVFLDSSTNAFAVTGAGNTSAGTFTPYGANWSNYFNGSSGNVSIPYNANYVLGTNDFTVECWVMFNDISATSRNLVSLGYGANGDGPVTCTWALWYLGSEGSNQLRFYRYNGSTETYYTTSGFSPSNGVWYHIAVSRTGGNLRIFGNGVALYSGANSINYTAINTSDPLLVGLGYFGPQLGMNGPRYFNGYISNLRVINGTGIYSSGFTPPTAPLTAVTNTKLLACQSNRYVDNSSIGATVTPGGNTTIQRFSPFGPLTQTAISYSAYFGGSSNSDTLSIASNAITALPGDFTLEAWVYPTSVPNTYLGIAIAIVTDGIWFGYLATGLGLRRYGASDVIQSSTAPIANVWTHVAVTRSGSTNRLFINGVLNTTVTDSTSYAQGALVIGSDGIPGNATQRWPGYISNLRITKGVAVYTGTFTPPTAPLSATQSSGTNIAAITGTQTSLLTCQSPTFVDNSTNALAITAYGNSQPKIQNPFGFTNTAVAYSSATYGGSAYFDGTGDYLTMTSNASLGFGTGLYTVECWVYATAAPAYAVLFAVGAGGLQLALDSANGYIALAHEGTGWLLSSSTLLPLNVWNHVAVSRAAAGLTKIFLNGNQIASGTNNTNFLTGTYANINLNVGNASKITGYISNVHIVKGTAVYTSNFVPPTAPLSAITNTSLLLNITSAGVYDSTMINDLETVGDAKRVATHTPYAGSYYSNYFDGTGDYLELASNSAFNMNTYCCLEAWVNYTTIGTSTIIAGRDSSYWLGYNFTAIGGTANKFVFTINNGSSWQAVSSTTTPVAGVWYHVVGIKDNTTLRIYINGTQENTAAFSGTAVTGSNVVGIGANQNTQNMAGYVSNTRLVLGASSGVLPYTGNFTSPTTPLTAVSGTALLTCQSNRFLDNSTNAFAVTRAGDTSVQSFNPFQRNSAATMYFDGTTDALFEPSNLSYGYGTGDFTIEVWLYLNATTTQSIVSNLTASNGASVAPHIYYANASGIRYYVNSADRITGSALSTGTWYHIAVSRSGSSTKMFINGTQTGSTYTDTNNYGTSNPLGVGDYAVPLTGVVTLNGYINDLRITKGYARYTATFTPPTTAFIAK